MDSIYVSGFVRRLHIRLASVTRRVNQLCVHFARARPPLSTRFANGRYASKVHLNQSECYKQENYFILAPRGSSGQLLRGSILW